MRFPGQDFVLGILLGSPLHKYFQMTDVETPALGVVYNFLSIQPSIPRESNYFISFPKALVLLFLGLLIAPAFNMIYVILTLLLAVVFVLLAIPIGFILCYFFSWATYNDVYTKVMILTYKFLFFARSTPTARGDMNPALLRPKATMKTAPLYYALNIRVPKASEEEFTKGQVSFSSALGVAFEENLYRLPYHTRGGDFGPSEDPVAYAMGFVGDVYPHIDTVYKEKCTDEAMTQMAFYGLGAHRLDVVTMKDMGPVSKEVVETKYFVVCTNALSQLPCREGLEHYGGDAYFDFKTWRVVKIVIQCVVEAWEKSFVTVRPGEPGWDYAKFRWRSSLFSLVTLVDHLYAIHMQVGNNVVTSMRQQLSKDHPLRRFLTPFTYQTISVNDNARNNLVNPNTMGPRNFALTDVGMDLAWAAAPSLLMSGLEAVNSNDNPQLYWRLVLDRGFYIEQVIFEKFGKRLTEYYTQSLAYWNAMKAFVTEYMVSYWGSAEAYSKDQEGLRFTLQALSLFDHTSIRGLTSSISFNPNGGAGEFNKDLLWEVTINLITRYCDLVTAGHEQVGTVPIYAQDVSFCAFQWKKGAMMGTKQGAVNAAVLMAFTSTPMPSLMVKKPDDDWSFLFLNFWKTADVLGSQDKAVAAYNKWQKKLVELTAKSEAWNLKALSDKAVFPENFGIWSQNPWLLESSVSV